MASAEPVYCSCKNNCIRPPGREGSNTRNYCKCYQNGTVCTYLCRCGHGRIECLNTIDAHLEQEAEFYDEAVLYDDDDDPLFQCEERPMPLAVFFEDHDGEVTVHPDDVLNTSIQDVATAQADKDASFMEDDDEEMPTNVPAEARRKGSANKNVDKELQTNAPGKARRRRRCVNDEYESAVEALTAKVSDLTTDGMATLVLKLIKLHPELVEMAMEPEPEPPLPGNNVGWCNCNMCRPMPTTQEQLCCSVRPNATCITLDAETRGQLNQIVLSRRALQVAIQNHNEYCVQNDDINDNNCLRHMAYRKFVLWQRGYLGPGKRVVIPSCVVWTIRDLYPSADGTYTGFIPSQVFRD